MEMNSVGYDYDGDMSMDPPNGARCKWDGRAENGLLLVTLCFGSKALFIS
jgi:hypothetical protein